MTTLVPKFQQPLTNAINRAFNLKLQESVSVLDFGADNTGSTDSTTAIQNAINSGAKKIFFPQGTYNISSSLSIPDVSGPSATNFGFELYGVYGQSIINATAANIIIFKYPQTINLYFTKIHDLYFTASNSGNGSAIGIGQTTPTAYIHFIEIKDCFFSAYLRYGITGAYLNADIIRNSFGTANTPTGSNLFKPIYMASSATGAHNVVNIRDNEFNSGNDDYVIDFYGGDLFVFEHNTCESNLTTTGIVTTGGCASSYYRNNWFENNNNKTTSGSGISVITPRDGSGSLASVYPYVVQIDGNFFLPWNNTQGANDYIINLNYSTAATYTFTNNEAILYSNLSIGTAQANYPLSCSFAYGNYMPSSQVLMIPSSDGRKPFFGQQVTAYNGLISNNSIFIGNNSLTYGGAKYGNSATAIPIIYIVLPIGPFSLTVELTSTSSGYNPSVNSLGTSQFAKTYFMFVRANNSSNAVITGPLSQSFEDTSNTAGGTDSARAMSWSASLGTGGGSGLETINLNAVIQTTNNDTAVISYEAKLLWTSENGSNPQINTA